MPNSASGTSILALRDLTGDEISQVHGLAVQLGLAGFALSCALAVPLGHFFRTPELPPVIAVLGFTFVVRSFQSVPMALLRRDLRFGKLAVVDGTQTVLLAVLSVALAYAGLRYWALVLVNVAGTFFTTGAVLWLQPQSLARPRFSSIQRAVRYSGTVLVERTAWYAYSNADFVVAGRMLGSVAVGIYQQAWGLAFMPLEKTTSLLMSVTPSIISAVQEDVAELRRYVMRIAEVTALATFPLSIGLALVAGDFVPLVLGEKWVGMVVPLRILAAYGALRGVQPLFGQVLVNTGRAAISARNTVAAAILMPIAFVIGSRWGVVGIATAWVLVHPLFALHIIGHVRRQIEVSWGDLFVQAFWPPVSASAVMVAAVLGFDRIGMAGQSGLVLLVGKVVVGAIAYVGTVLLLHRSRLPRYRAIAARFRG